MQRTALFTELPERLEDRPLPATAAAWRAAWVDAGVGDYPGWNQVRVVALRHRLWVIPGTPAANEWLESHLDAIAGVVADLAGAPVPLEWRTREVGVRVSDDLLWAYRLPVVVVEKYKRDWAPHFETPLSDGLRDGLARRLEHQLCTELDAWGRLPSLLVDTPFLVVADPGRAAAINSISAARSGHGKPVTVLCRRHVVLLSYYRIEGECFLGPLASLGHGRVIRETAPELLDRYTQRALLDIPSSAKELV